MKYLMEIIFIKIIMSKMRLGKQTQIKKEKILKGKTV